MTKIISEMGDKGTKSYTVVSAINSLVKKKYKRRITGHSNKTYYVQLGVV